MKLRLYILSILVVSMSAVNSSLQASDSLKIFPFKDFYNIVLSYHPIAKQAALLDEMAQRELRVARGGFDPKYDFDYTRKVFKGTNYYDYIDNGLKVPLWFGTDVKAGFERNSGQFINPTNFTPPEGLWYLGLDVPIGQGIIMDERRAVVRQAQMSINMADAEKVKIINKILLSAAKEYWEWYYQYHRSAKTALGYELAKIRYEAVKERATQGDLAGIDSIEASITLQDRWVEYQNALNDFQNAGLGVSNFLWSEDGSPLQIDNMRPEEPIEAEKIWTDSTFKKLSDYARQSHPDLIKMNYKISQLKLDKKLKFNNMLPNVMLGAKYLSTPNQNVWNDLNYNYTMNNYKITVTLSQPLFLRKERGKYQMAGIKIKQAEYEQMMVQREIDNGVSAAYNDVLTFKDLIVVQEKVFQNSTKLFDGERTRFDAGESTLFLVNSRESKMIESQIKVHELKGKLQKAIAHLYWSAGSFQ